MFKAHDRIAWLAPEFAQHKRGADWYWIVSLLSITILVITLLSGNFLFTIMTLIATGLFFVLAERKPKMIHIDINPTGVSIENDIYTFENIEAFWIVVMPHDQYRLLLLTKKVMMPLLSVMIPENIEPRSVREVLIEKVTERKLDEPIGNHIADIIRF